MTDKPPNSARFHPDAGLFPNYTRSKLAELTESIRTNGQREPIWVDDQGRIIDGRHRWLACREAGVEPITRTFDESVQGPVLDFVVDLNLHRRDLNESQRAMIAARLATLRNGSNQYRKVGTSIEGPMTTPEAAAKLSVGRASVERAREVQDHGVPELVDAVEAGEVSVSRAALLSRLDEDKQREAIASNTRKALHSSATCEWYTPDEYIDAARAVLGGIDLDPASCAAANAVVGAKRIFTVDDDGLSKKWSGRVWLNPPYGRGDGAESTVARWLSKASHEYTSGRAKQIIALVNASTDCEWFIPLWDRALCFVYGRIRFWRPGDERNSPTHGSVFAYWGEDVKGFASVFAEHGHIVLPTNSGNKRKAERRIDNG